MRIRSSPIDEALHLVFLMSFLSRAVVTNNLNVNSNDRIENERGIITGMIMVSGTRRAIACSSSLQCGGMESIDVAIHCTLISHELPI